MKLMAKKSVNKHFKSNQFYCVQKFQVSMVTNILKIISLYQPGRQIEAWEAARPQQLALFEQKEDRRPEVERIDDVLRFLSTRLYNRRSNIDNFVLPYYCD